MDDENAPPEETPAMGGSMPPSNEMHPEDGSHKMHEDRVMGVGDHHNHNERPLDNDAAMKGNDDFSHAMRPLFLGNLTSMCTAPDIEEIFHRPIISVTGPGGGDPNRPIPVDRVDLKRGFCFVFLKDAACAEDKLRVEQFVSEINGMNIDKVSKALRSEFARGDGRIKRKEDARRAQITPSETLFVVNFNEDTTKREDLQSLFQPYGELIRIDMKRNYAFVQFSTVDEARRAKESTDGGKLDQSQITVEYVARKMGEGRDRRRGDRDRDRDRMRDDRMGSYGGGRGPPEYGRGRDYRRDDRYDDFRGGRRDDRYDDKGFRGRDRSPIRDRGRDDSGFYRGRGRSRSRSRSPGYRRRSRSPEPRLRDHYDDRGRDDYRGGGSYRDGGGRGRSNERDYRDSGRERSSEREYRGDRGYRSERGYGGRMEAGDSGR